MTALSRLEDLSLEEVDISHSGNQISRITNKGDLYPDYYSGFVSYSDGSAYAYNANGAMTSDPDKGAQYAYNAFGMPSQVKVPAILGTIDYKYSATGERLEASYKWHSGLSLDPQENVNRPTYTATNSSKLRQYVGNKVYENGSLKRILLDNGYIEGGIYYFYLRDHLGNNSVVAKADGQVVQRNHYYPYGKTIGNGESWGQAAQPYKFGGKEEETMFGLELYDFHARQMDRRIPGFLGVDPLCEKYYSISPYAYCAGNPVLLVDPNGLEWFYYSVDGKADPTWNWRDEHEYHTGVKDTKGKEVVLTGYEAVVTMDGSTGEKTGKGNSLFGEDAVLADVTVYGPNGKDDIKTYRGFSMTSDFSKYGAIDNGEYEVNYRNPGKSGQIKSNWAVNNTYPVDCLFGENRNPDGYSDTQKNGVYIHSTLGNSGRVGSRTSTGCILIVPSGHGENGWDEFNTQLQGVSSFHFVLNRTATVPYSPFQVYPLPSKRNLQYNIQWLWKNSKK